MESSSSSSSSSLSSSPASASPATIISSSSSSTSSSAPSLESSRSVASGHNVVTRARPPQRWVLRNPFVFRVGTTMTGIGVGCGIGVGVGSPINLAALPGVGPAIGGGVNSIQGSLSGFSWQVQRGVSLLGGKLGVKGLRAGMGCGVGIGYGFGVGLALKPGVRDEILHALKDGMVSLTEYMVSKWGPQEEGSSDKAQQIISGMLLQGRALGGGPSQQTTPALPSQGAGGGRFVPTMGGASQDQPQVSQGSLAAQPQFLTHATGGMLSGSRAGDTNRSRDGGQLRRLAENDISSRIRVEVDKLQSENEQLRALLRHENEIASLRDENVALKRVLSQVLDLEVDDFRAMSSSGSPSDVVLNKLRCFECRRRRRRR